MKTAIIVALCGSVVTATGEAADQQAVRVVRDVAYLQGASDSDNKDRLDLYLPAGRTNVPVIVSWDEMGGERDEVAERIITFVSR